MLLEPCNISLFGVGLHLPKQLHNLGLKTWLTWIGIGNYRIDFDGHHETVGSNQPRPPDSFS
jgi:hypothetical protein